MKLMPKKGGHGHVTSYLISVGSAEAREAGFIDKDGNRLELVKIVDNENKQILIRLKPES